MPISKTCPSCQRTTTITTRDGVAIPDQRCSHCGFRLPNDAMRPKLKSSDYGP